MKTGINAMQLIELQYSLGVPQLMTCQKLGQEFAPACLPED